MRTKFIAGNWKMNTTAAKAKELAAAVVEKTKGATGVQVAVCPPAVYLSAVAQVLAGSHVGLGGQNMHFKPEGAFTGETSAAMLLDVGCKYVILGHSERRHGLGETDAFINQKVKAALEKGLTPILCVGELLAEREANQTDAVIAAQITGSMADLTAEQATKLVIAYEPVWAIGTGKTASPEQAEEVHVHLRKLLETRYNPTTAASIQIQYGGSVTGDNAKTLLSMPNIDGALVGGAALKPDDFAKIVLAAAG